MTIELDAGAVPLDRPRATTPVDLPREARPDAAFGSRDGGAFVFTGTGSAYFRIWIVNLLLTIVTIGIYSPWAKVRRLRYFYGNTLVDGSPFEFHGSPFALLKGRLIGLVLLIAYTQSAKVSLAVWFGVVVVLLALLPWLLWKSLRFRLGNSSYRGIHFAFDGTIGQAYLTFVPLMLMVLGPAAVLVVAQQTLGAAPNLKALGRYYAALGVVLLLAPWFYFRWRAYQHRNARIGQTPFGFDGRVGQMYMIAVKGLLFGIAVVILATIAAAIVGGVAWLAFKRMAPDLIRIGPIAFGVAAFYIVAIGSWGFVKGMTQNFVWNESTLGGTRFVSRVSRTRLWGIELGNLVLTLLTLGFYWPFAVVRSMRYRIGALSWEGDPGALTSAADDRRIGATGEETAELFGLDIAL